MMSLKIRTFYLLRHQDVSGMSGTGIVAVGVVYPNGRAHLQWVSYKTSFEQHDTLENLLDLHHVSTGETELIWGDPPSPEDKPARKPRKKKGE